jgi:Protein of unknown function with PCYCGC motif
MKHFLGVLTILLAAGMTHAQFVNQAAEVPAFHPAPAKAGTQLAPILTQKQLADQGMIAPAQIAAYKAAAKAGPVLYQMPCYCYCDRNHGHTSLRSCFESTHGANCSTCMQEALYSYRQSQKGWSAKMIRAGILRGDFKLLDLQNPEPVK